MKVGLILAEPNRAKDESKAKNNFRMPYIRMAWALNDALGWDVIFPMIDKDYALRQKYDVLIFVYNSWYKDYGVMLQILEKNPNAVKFWMTNEYDCPNLNFLGEHSLILNYEHRQFMEKI